MQVSKKSTSFILNELIDLNEMFFIRLGVNGFHLDTFYDENGELLESHNDQVFDLSATSNLQPRHHGYFDSHPWALFITKEEKLLNVLFYNDSGDGDTRVYLRPTQLDYTSNFLITYQKKTYPIHYLDCFGFNLSKIDNEIVKIQIMIRVYDDDCDAPQNVQDSYVICQNYGIPRKGSIRLLQDKKQFILHRLIPSLPDIRNMHLLDIVRTESGWRLDLRMEEWIAPNMDSYFKKLTR